MRQEKIEYGLLVEAALRQVVRDVLGRLMRDEVAQPHHFYITFRTTHSGVVIPEFLLDRYPTEMTIVLQHQYWDLEVGETSFSVTLSFNDKHERLIIPFDAIKVFADPGVEFGLQFTIDVDDDVVDEDHQPIRLERKTDLSVAPTDGEDGGDSADADGDRDETQDKSGAEIVALDRFRKK
ncbi:MAG: ClpXP protease specificity-enhancing factor SspB [Geminicoccaceae bacterium]